MPAKNEMEAAHFGTLCFVQACFSRRSFSDILDALSRYRVMDNHYYEVFRRASQEAFYQAVNNPEDELYDVVWDLFETAVIEPGEIFDTDFRNQNQFRYSIDNGVTLEFFPGPSYFRRRVEPNPYEDDSDAAGIHMQFSILPCMSCLFSVGFRVWGRPERIAFKRLWQQHRGLLSDTFRRSKPMVFTAAPFPSVDYASTLEDMLDNYFSVRDAEHFIELQYPFAQFDEIDNVQKISWSIWLFSITPSRTSASRRRVAQTTGPAGSETSIPDIPPIYRHCFPVLR